MSGAGQNAAFCPVGFIGPAGVLCKRPDSESILEVLRKWTRPYNSDVCFPSRPSQARLPGKWGSAESHCQL